MQGLFLRSVTGREGKVMIPALGAVAGTISYWSLTRREESTPENPGAMTLRASLSYKGPLFEEESLIKEVILELSRNKHYRVCSGRMAVEGDTLVMEGVELCLV